MITSIFTSFFIISIGFPLKWDKITAYKIKIKIKANSETGARP